MSIFKNLKKVHAAVTADLVNDAPTLSALINAAAVKAIMGGKDSDEFKSYMAIFADNPEQLERLTVPKDGEPAYIAQMRAYIVANAICDAGTNAHTGNKVTSQIDGDPANNVPMVPEAVNDPGGVIVGRRPAGLKNIPGVHS